METHQVSENREPFKFEISLSVLNHLGRNLYRNFITVLGEAISNSWDADANNVWIEIDRENSTFTIMDDGGGMSAEDFQTKFLKIGYSKRKKGEQQSEKGRPFIGAKGIGKLALLSCAQQISIYSKTKTTGYTGGVIDNSKLDDAIKNDLIPDEYPLVELNFDHITGLTEKHDSGTIIHFAKTKDYLKNSDAHLKKLLAMTFRFSLLDDNFKIFVNGSLVTIDDVKDLSSNTEFCWTINRFSDQFTQSFMKLFSEPKILTTPLNIKGFLATVELPRHLKITGTEERATIDLFVNGRLREKDILRHIPTQRILESYIYGQIHFDEMDQADNDPFTSSREGIVEDDGNFQALLEYLKKTVMPQILDEWDKLRLSRQKPGDDENTNRASKKERNVKNLLSSAQEEYKPEDDGDERDQVEVWLRALAPDAEFNISSYVDCFLSENLVRKFMQQESVPLTKPAQTEVSQWRDREKKRKDEANISFNIRKDNDDLSYLGLDYLTKSIEGNTPSAANTSLVNDAVNYKPIRNVVGHTGLLTDHAKQHLSLTFENIKSRVQNFLK